MAKGLPGAVDAQLHGCLIAYDNYVDSAELSTDVLVDPTYPLDALKTRQLGDAFVTEGPMTVDADFGERRKIVVAGLLGINWRQVSGGVGFINVSVSDDGLAWNSVGSYAAYDFGVPDLARHAVLVFGEPVWGQYLRVEANWGTDDDGPLRIGRLWASNGLLIPRGCDAGWRSGADDSGALDQSDDKQAFESLGVRTRREQVSLSNLHPDVAYGINEEGASLGDVPSIQDVQFRVGTTSEVLVVVRTWTPTWIRRTAVYGHLDRVPEIVHTTGPLYSTSLTAIEER